MINRIEELTGRRWAAEVCSDSMALLSTIGGREKLIERLKLGEVQKPKSYAIGVRGFISDVEDALDMQAIRGKV
jgi:hypothetical protein